MAAAAHNAIYTFLHTHKAKDVVADKKSNVLSLRATDSVEKAVKTLSDNKILSAPVLDGKSNEVVGSIDYLDIVKFVTSAAPSPAAIKADELKSLTISGRAIALVSISELMKRADKSAFVTMFQDSPASELVDVFSTGVHRVCLTDETGNVVNVCSQSDLARFLVDKLPTGDLKVLGERKLSQLGYASTALFTVKSDDTVLFALNSLVNNGVSALAVVNDDGKLVGNFSASNLRGLYYDKFPKFLDNVYDFLEANSPLSLNPVAGLAENTLHEVVNELVNNKLHHLWLVDDFKPVGSISLTDVVKIIKNAPQP